MQRPLRRSRSFRVADFGTNRKLIYDFLLVINTNLPACTVSKLWLIIGHIFASERGIDILITETETKTRMIDFSFTETKTNTEKILKN